MEFHYFWDWNAFNRLIAKITHAFAVSVVGLEGVEWLLPPLIRGEAFHFSNLIGGIDDPKLELTTPHDLVLYVRQIGEAHYLVGLVTMFGAKRFPTYMAVTAKILDLDLILAKIA